MYLLTYQSFDKPDHKPTAPVQIFSEGILEETITDWWWSEGGLFKKGWLPKTEFNFEHPKMLALIRRSHIEQQHILDRRGYRYPHH
jgi:hypothetical protein